MAKKKETMRVWARLTEEEIERLDEQANTRDRSRAAQIRNYVNRGVREDEKEDRGDGIRRD